MISEKIKIGYFADGPWSHNGLEMIIEDQNIEIKFICARYKNPDNILRNKAKCLGVDFITAADVNNKDFILKVSRYQCDLFVSMSFDQIMKKSLFSLPDLGTINCHAGKLPSYRGRNILNWVLINDEREFGITVHYIDEGIDTGDIICQETFPINDSDTYSSLLKKAYLECPKLLLKSIKKIYNRNVKPIPQDKKSKFAFYCTKRIIGDEVINWNQPSRDIFNFIRALTYPGPCASTSFDLQNKVKIVSSEMILNAPNFKGIPGSILEKFDDGFLVKTSDSYIKIREYESESNLYVGLRFDI